MPGLITRARAGFGRRDELTPEQFAARERWQQRWNLPILLAAFIPLFVTSPKSRAVEVAIGVGSWLVFPIDLTVQRRIVPDYLMATKGLRRFAQRLGRVAVIAAEVVFVCSLSAYDAEHSTNPGFATFGDALWWGVVTLTTVGYGDIVPRTTTGRLAGVAIMFTGIAVLGVLAGSLASLFGIASPAPDEKIGAGAEATESVPDELAALRAQLLVVEQGLGSLAERLRSPGP